MNPTVFIRLATAAVCGPMTSWPSIDRAVYTYMCGSCAGMYIGTYICVPVILSWVLIMCSLHDQIPNASGVVNYSIPILCAKQQEIWCKAIGHHTITCRKSIGKLARNPLIVSLCLHYFLCSQQMVNTVCTRKLPYIRPLGEKLKTTSMVDSQSLAYTHTFYKILWGALLCNLLELNFWWLQSSLLIIAVAITALGTKCFDH